MLRALACLTLVAWLADLAAPGAAQAQQEEAVAAAFRKGPPITFSNLVIRVQNEDIGFAADNQRVLLLETMRSEGWNAVGAENLVFDRDDSSNADFVLGGTLREAKCQGASRTGLCCGAGIEWELLQVASKRVIYKAMTRTGECDLFDLDAKTIGRRLLIRSLRRLLHRSKFAATVASAQTKQAEASYEVAELERCKLKSIDMKRTAEPALDGTVLLSAGMVHGSGFFLTDDGLLATAAHVVSSNKLQVVARDGSKYDAYPLRISRRLDVALLRVSLPEGQHTQCLPLATERRNVGSELYAIGAPDSKDLAFSLTRGILSGTRLHEGVQLVQTDAPVSPGNSGGPLVDSKGQVVGIVSRKLVGSAVEGVAFGVPTDEALRALGLSLGKRTDATLATATPVDVSVASDRPFVDTPDPAPQVGMANRGGVSDHVRFDKRVDPVTNHNYVQGTVALDRYLDLKIVVAPAQLDGRFALTFVSDDPTLVRVAPCKAVSLVLNERTHTAKELITAQSNSDETRTATGTPLKDTVFGVEARFDLALLSRLDEEAPSAVLYACKQHWTLSRKQIESLRKVRRAYKELHSAGD